MATRAAAPRRIGARGDQFFAWLAMAMAIVLISGFSMNLAMGRSSFSSPLVTHLHAVVFMGWVVLFVVQAQLGASGSLALHRRLGWFGAAMVAVLLITAFAIIVSMVRRDVTPFFFRPQHLMIVDPMTALAFAGLTVAAIRMRRRTDWHARLHIGAMTMLMGPGVGRLLPMPYLGEYAFEIAFFVGGVFALVGALRDLRRDGRVHPAWLVTLAMMPLLVLAARGIAFSPVGDALYRAATAGSPGAEVDGRAQALHRLPPAARAAIYGK